MKKVKFRAVFMIVLLALFLVLILFGKQIAPNDPYVSNLQAANEAPSAQYPFGTDNLGRCILSRILTGAAASVYSAIFIVAVVFFAGTVIGLVAGYGGGWVDQVLMKITMVFQAFPSFILAVAIAGMLGPGLKNAMISLMAMYWTSYARLARSLVLQVKNETYIRAAFMCGAKKRHILFRHILPNIILPLMTAAVSDISNVILSMAGLSFLGLGVQAPQAEWGLMISNGRQFLQTAPWAIIFPSAALFVSVVLFNLTGDCVRDVLNDGGGR
ncbi:MAG: ABC transporter permease [Lachnospiraceae bacterium]|nr:ABC transporter permease [Lachnospiraceae bacterium]